MLNKAASVVALAAAGLAAIAQPSASSPFAPPPNGPRTAEPTAFAITNATVHTAPGEVSIATTVMIRDGVIERVATAVDADAVILDGYRIIDGEGLHLYPGFIDAWVQVESPDLAVAPGRHPSKMVQPERDVLLGSGLDKDKAEGLRKLGFGAAAIVPTSGIFRGMGAVVSTAEPYADDSMGRTPVYAGQAMDVMGFSSAGWGSTGHQMDKYPNSHMGMMALIRQTYLDADHWQANGPHATASSFDAVNPGEAGRPTFWNVSNTLQWMLADKVFGEFEHENLVVVGAGDEYQRLDVVTDAGHAVVVPLRFPAKPDLATVHQVDSVSLAQLQAWEQAPTNPRLLLGAGLSVSITSSKLPDGAKFHDNLRRAIEEGGLSADDALAMLTTNPAELLGVSETLGTIEPGKAANLVVTDGELFAKKTKIHAVWVDGREDTLHEPDKFPLNGDWQLRIDGNLLPLGFSFDDKKITSWETNAEGGRDTYKGRNSKVDGGAFSLLLDSDDTDTVYVISGALQSNGEIIGSSFDGDGNNVPYALIKTELDDEDAEEADDDEGEDAGDEEDGENEGDEDGDDEDGDAASKLIPAMPAAGFGPYAVSEAPAQDPVLVTGATIWTSGPDGIIENGFLFASGGKIIAVGRGNPDGSVNYQVPDNARQIDGAGMHLTPGLIDTHSHTGLFQLGVNESGQAITAECQIGDALDPANINWYRQIAGGITTAQLLHGSANAIGGQSQTVKPRWGVSTPQEYFLDGAKPGIKFALGENPRGANWDGGDRYPQTRMGVEALIRDRIVAGKAYADNGMRTPDGRIDLELQAVAEIVKGERMIHCHSYRQDEILMLCNIASEFGITIGTFQHGLEVYKVAEAVAANAIGASIFSDWWAYKLEVQDAIAQGGPVASEAGVLMSYNSDSDDLARRMNLEAAKAAKYSQGRLSKEEALKFVTINPAIQLGLGGQIGSLEPGKDADFALWNGDPMSAFSKCEATYIDGREYFSTAKDLAHREHNNAERQRLIAKVIAAPDKGEDKAKGDKDGEGRPGRPGRPGGEDPDHVHAAGDAHLTSGDQGMSPGDCGCATPPLAIEEIR